MYLLMIKLFEIVDIENVMDNAIGNDSSDISVAMDLINGQSIDLKRVKGSKSKEEQTSQRGAKSCVLWFFVGSILDQFFPIFLKGKLALCI